MAVPIPRNTDLVYHSFPLLLQFLALYGAYYYNLQEFIDKTQARVAGFGSESQEERTHFDYIIVGGGTTGSVLANRLSADPRNKVLLLEAGGDPTFYTKIPLLSTTLFGKIPEDWKYKTLPQTESCLGLEGNSMPWPCGHGLGGSGILNGMVYLRGSVQGFDTVAKLTGDPIWRLENMLKYYKKVEDYYGFFDDGLHGKSGPLAVGRSHLSPYIAQLEAGLHELGYPTVDPNPYGPTTEGFSPMDLHIRFGRRWSAFDGYLRPVTHRPNLVVRKFSYAYKILFAEGSNEKEGIQRAIGVEYFRHGAPRKAYALKEVIISSGAVQSPKILLLSGIGPREHLASVGVPLRLDLPVGQNLQDKYGAYIGPFVLEDGSGSRLPDVLTVQNFAKWLFTGTGSIASSSIEASYSYRTNISRERENLNVVDPRADAEAEPAPDIHTYVVTTPIDPYIIEPLLTGSLGFKKSLVRHLTGRPDVLGREAFVQLVNVAKPFSVGTVTLRDANPFSPPLIDPKYFSDPDGQDLARLVEGIKFAVRVGVGAAAKLSLPDPFPGCEGLTTRSDEYWACIARQTTGTAYKYGGTAPVGSGVAGDGVSVVDSRLRVHGVRGLRVVDGSVLQEQHMSVNMVTCAALGELAAEFLLEEHVESLKA